MRIAVVGAGPMGSLYAGMLARAGADTWLIGRSPDHVAAIRREGLRIQFPGRTDAWRIPLPATTDPAAPGEVDAVLFLTKMHDLAEAALRARPLFGAHTIALPLCNGLGASQAIRGALGPVALAGGVSEVGGDLLAPGVMVATGNVLSGAGVTRVGAIDAKAAAGLEALAARLTAAGLATEVLADIESFIWTKLAMAGTMSSISALTRLRIGPIAGSKAGWAVIEATITEIATVAAAAGVAFDRDATLTRARTVFAAVPDHVPSMSADLRQRRRTENAALLGAVASEGARLGVPTPIADTVSRLVEVVEAHPGESIW